MCITLCTAIYLHLIHRLIFKDEATTFRQRALLTCSDETGYSVQTQRNNNTKTSLFLSTASCHHVE
jgi:hypothetical protein